MTEKVELVVVIHPENINSHLHLVIIVIGKLGALGIQLLQVIVQLKRDIEMHGIVQLVVIEIENMILKKLLVLLPVHLGSHVMQIKKTQNVDVMGLL